MAKVLSQQFIKESIGKYINFLKKDGLKISDVFLFGSYANGNPNKYSDVDVCIVSPQFKNRIQAGAYLNKKLYYSNITSDIPFELIGYPAKHFGADSILVSEIKKGIKLV